MSATAPTESMMSSVGSGQPTVTAPFLGGDHRTVFRGVDWHTYQQLSKATDEGKNVRLLYDGKDLEIMVTGNVHERYKEWFMKIVTALSMARDLDYVPCGQTTWKTLIRGLEADLSYYFDVEKIQKAREALARQSMNPDDYPHPDLAIEIDMSPPQVDRPMIYRDLQVAEVWRLVRGQELVIEQLQANGTYATAKQSRFLHVSPEDVVRWLNDAKSEPEVRWNRRLFEWAMGLDRPA